MIDYFAELERRAWQSYEQAKTLYHVAPWERALQISLGGIRAPEGDDEPAIWFFTDKSWAGEVAASIGLQNFALFSIRKGAIKRETIRWDNVAEHCALVSFYCLRSHIPQSYVRWIGTYSVGLTPSERSVIAHVL